VGRVFRRPAARADLIDIYRYIAGESSRERAAAYLHKIEKTLSLISDHPGMGTKRLQNHPDVRAYPVRNHLLFFRPLPEGDGIDLIRVLHGARDWQSIIGGDD